jgi:SAM-dependent methyltransferase
MIKNYKIEELKEITNKKKNSYKTDKELYGEVLTPFFFIEKMFNIFPNELFKNPNLKWLDPGSGTGNFSIFLYYKLLENLDLDNDIKKDHIIKNMIYILEYREENIIILREIFGEEANIFHMNYLNYEPDISFDIIIGNPPFNFNGLKKVPTNSKNCKKNDGQTIWIKFIKHSINLLKKNGYLNMFIPSIWLKPDKEKTYYYLLQYNIKYLNCFSNTETNQIFKGNAQTPCCFFLLKKEPSDNNISIYERKNDKYINFKLKKDIPIPLCNIKIVNDFQKVFEIYKCKNIDVIKTNLPPKNISISKYKIGDYKYPNIRTRLQKDKKLIIEYSNKPLIGYNKSKIVLANKMYGIPYLDLSGEYGISNRDNYIIYKDKIEDLKKIYDFLSTEKVQEIYKSTRYRMMYLEKYAFQLLPDITLI